MMGTRSRAYARTQRRRAIHHKAMILRDYWHENGSEYWNAKRIGALDKGKVHCSCPICRRKSYDRLRTSEIRKNNRDEQKVADYDSEP